jgi:hypothetical protein
MRVVDELTNERADRSLPAPCGLPAPTGQQPFVPPQQLPRAPKEPTGPRLPPRAPREPSPLTGQLGITMLATSVQTTAVKPLEDPPAPQRRGKLLIPLAITLVILAVAAVALRNTPIGQRITGHGYDSSPLPVHAIPLPAFSGAQYTVTYQDVAIDNGLATNFWYTERDEINFATQTAKATLDTAAAPIIGGTISTPKSTSPPQEQLIDERSRYEPGAAVTDPWIRTPHPTGVWSAVLNKSEIYMYQDVFDPALRAQQPAKVVHEIRHGASLTTYTYTFAFGDFYESAPHVFNLARAVDGNAADDAKVTVTVSLDDHWMVRYLDVDVDHASVLEHRAKADVGTKYPYRLTIDLISITDKPATITIPLDVVDQRSDDPTTTAVP